MSIARVVEPYRYPRHAWGWQGATLVLGLVVAPQASALLLVPELRNLAAAAAVAGLVFYPVVFVSGVFLYLHWRLTSTSASYWLTVALSLVSVHGVALSTLQMIRADAFLLRPIWFIGSDVVVGIVLLAMVRVAERVTPAADPAAAGLVLGLVVAVPEILVSRAADSLPRVSTVELPAMTLLVLVGLLLVPNVHRLTSLPLWCRDRLGLAALVLSVHRVLAHPPTPDGPAWYAAGLVTGMVGSVLLCSACLALLRSAIHDDRAAIRQLQDLLTEAETEARADRDRLHQIRGAVAGITSASALIATEPSYWGLPPSQLQALESLVACETARLQRLVEDRRTPGDDVVDLDDVLGPLAAAQRLLGHRVHWTPSGHRVRGSQDGIAEVVQTLLDNARVHAGDTPVDIEVLGHGGDVTITVADRGPGVPAELQPSIFERGTRREGSVGQGIGLHVARQIMEDAGSTLRLEPSGVGAAFVVRLPAADRETA